MKRRLRRLSGSCRDLEVDLETGKAPVQLPCRDWRGQEARLGTHQFLAHPQCRPQSCILKNRDVVCVVYRKRVRTAWIA